MSAIGVSWPVSSVFLRVFVVTLSLVPLGILFFCARSCTDYRPFFLGVMAVVGLYLCKFRLALDAGTYMSGATLFGATIWSVKLRRDHAHETRCSCVMRTSSRIDRL